MWTHGTTYLPLEGNGAFHCRVFFMLAETLEVQWCHSLSVDGFILASQWAGYIITLTSICLLLCNDIKPVLCVTTFCYRCHTAGAFSSWCTRPVNTAGQLQMDFEMVVMFGFISNWPFFFLTFPHDGRSSTGVTNNINGGVFPLRSASLGAPRRSHAGSLARLSGSVKTKWGIVNRCD